MPEVLYLPWCLASFLPRYCSPPTPVSRWPGCCPQCTSTQPTSGAPVGKARQPRALRSSGQQEGRLNGGGPELEINPLYILMQLQLRSHNRFLGFWIFSWKIVLIWYFGVCFFYSFRSRVLPQRPQKNIKSKIRLFLLSWSYDWACFSYTYDRDL